ncbi:zinc finger protein 862-like isoform X2 [Ptychodera flava]|uniref:zinc finger protein 862-like isoform X2 n=1 Tax=Ptychodera flava TaxID=63121 RepID=UPI00396A1537
MLPVKHAQESVKEPLQQAVSESKVLSIVFDGATDSSISEVELVYCRILDKGYPRDILVGLEDLQHAHADGVFDAIGRAMQSFAGENWLDKLVAAGSDGASVNLGNHDSVRTRLQQGRDYIVAIHCVAHRLELGVLDAIKNNNMMQTIQDLLKKLYKHYHYSPKALRELHEIAELMEEKIIKPTRLQGTRWVPHVQKASQSLIRSYQVFITHFEHISQGGPGSASAEVKGRATFIAKKLKDFRVLRFLFFLQDVLDIISRLSLQLQRSDSTCIDFLDSFESAALSLTELSSTPGQRYAGFIEEVRAGNGKFKDVTLAHYDGDLGYEFAKDICDDVIQRLCHRLENNRDKSTEIIQAGRIFDLKDWPRDRLDLANYGHDQIRLLSGHFRIILERNECDVTELQNEWMHVKAHFGQRLRNNPGTNQPYQINTLLAEQNPRLTNILKLIEIVLVLPTSTAICERGFSTLKRIKSDWRSRLTTAMMNHLLWISIEAPSLQEYNAERAVHLWWSKAQRQRRPQFVQLTVPQDVVDQPDSEEQELVDFLMSE